MKQNQRPRRGWHDPKMAALAGAVLCAVTGSAVGAQTAPPAENPFNDELMHLSPQEQSAKLADHLGVRCIGTKPFFMGVTKDGPAKGYAYWSITCAGADSYLIQISPDGKGAATDCRTLKEGGEGRQCYKTF